MNMDELRGRIDAVDDELLRCFAERMDIAGNIARYKAEHGLPVLDERREREKLYAVSEKAPEELQSYAVSLYALLFELSRSRQNRLLHKQSPLAESIQTAIEQTPPLFPEKAAVACQGGCSACRTSFTFQASTRCSTPSKRASAATVCCPSKTAPRVR